MSQTVKFNHESNTLHEALGLDGIHVVSKKVAPVMQSLAYDKIKLSQAAELIYRGLEPNEILLLAATQLKLMAEMAIEEIEKQKNLK